MHITPETVDVLRNALKLNGTEHIPKINDAIDLCDSLTKDMPENLESVIRRAILLDFKDYFTTKNKVFQIIKKYEDQFGKLGEL